MIFLPSVLLVRIYNSTVNRHRLAACLRMLILGSQQLIIKSFLRQLLKKKESYYFPERKKKKLPNMPYVVSYTNYLGGSRKIYEEKYSGVLKGKSVSKSPLSSRISKSSIGELVTEVGAETISVISDSEVCTFWTGPVLPSDVQKRFDSEVSGDINAEEKLSMKWFSIMVSGKMLLSSFSDPIDGERKQNHGKISSLVLVSKSSDSTSRFDSKVKILFGGCSIFSCFGRLF